MVGNGDSDEVTGGEPVAVASDCWDAVACCGSDAAAGASNNAANGDSHGLFGGDLCHRIRWPVAAGV